MKLLTTFTAYDVKADKALATDRVPLSLAVQGEGLKAEPVGRTDDLGVDVDFESAATNMTGSGTSAIMQESVTLMSDALNLEEMEAAVVMEVLVGFAVGTSIGGGISDAPKDGKTYGRCNGAWVEVTGGGSIEWDD